jgi:hypothetical protein
MECQKLIIMMENDVLRDVAHRIKGFLYFQSGMKLHGKGLHIILYSPECTSSPAPISRNPEMSWNFMCRSRIHNFVKFVRMTSEFRAETHPCCRVKFGFHYAVADITRSHSIIVRENCCTEFYVCEKYLVIGGTR